MFCCICDTWITCPSFYPTLSTVRSLLWTFYSKMYCRWTLHTIPYSRALYSSAIVRGRHYNIKRYCRSRQTTRTRTAMSTAMPLLPRDTRKHQQRYCTAGTNGTVIRVRNTVTQVNGDSILQVQNRGDKWTRYGRIMLRQWWLSSH